MTQAQLTVLAGPTAVGKGTVVAALRERYPHLLVSVSATTRNPRPGEVNGVHYYFVSPEEFDSMIEGGEMLEWALVHGKTSTVPLAVPLIRLWQPENRCCSR